MDAATPVPMADPAAMSWQEHPRIREVFMKTLLTAADNPLASLNMVQVPVGRAVSRHVHLTQVETVVILRGRTTLVLGEDEVAFGAGQVVAIPAGLEHELINVGDEPVELLAFFTPPL